MGTDEARTPVTPSPSPTPVEDGQGMPPTGNQAGNGTIVNTSPGPSGQSEPPPQRAQVPVRVVHAPGEQRVAILCGRCGGRMFREPGTLDDGSVELCCMRCGARRYGRVAPKPKPTKPTQPKPQG